MKNESLSGRKEFSAHQSVANRLQKSCGVCCVYVRAVCTTGPTTTSTPTTISMLLTAPMLCYMWRPRRRCCKCGDSLQKSHCKWSNGSFSRRLWSAHTHSRRLMEITFQGIRWCFRPDRCRYMRVCGVHCERACMIAHQQPLLPLPPPPLLLLGSCRFSFSQVKSIISVQWFNDRRWGAHEHINTYCSLAENWKFTLFIAFTLFIK